MNQGWLLHMNLAMYYPTNAWEKDLVVMRD
jgi:hypothetical protein